MIFINKAAVDSGQVLANTASPTTSIGNVLQSIRYDANQKMYVNTGTPIATDRQTNGGRFDANGALFVLPVETEGVPANISSDGGLAFDLNGQLLVTTAVAVRYANGWPLDQRGFVCMNIV